MDSRQPDLSVADLRRAMDEVIKLPDELLRQQLSESQFSARVEGKLGSVDEAARERRWLFLMLRQRVARRLNALGAFREAGEIS